MTSTQESAALEQRAGSARVVLAGGGTAGHISPLLAIAHAIRDEREDASVCAVGTASGMETRLVPAAGVDLELIGRVPLPRKPSVDLLRLPRHMATAVHQAGRILDSRQATVVVGVGGYVCTPVYLAARRRGIPVVIHEANAKPGIANRVGARFATAVATA
ncbi:MAG: glycosyltransferase, partial [Kocuria rhizophila]|nr:glycosyltransferase [Kocuria rhizophila]